MATDSIDCYLIPGNPLDLVLPHDCIAEVVTAPEIELLSSAPAAWMVGHANWENQRLPVLAYDALHDAKLKTSPNKNSTLVVLNPIPNAARKAYSALICSGKIESVSVASDIEEGEGVEGIDKRYVEEFIKVDEKSLIIPRLEALGVAFSYF